MRMRLAPEFRLFCLALRRPQWRQDAEALRRAIAAAPSHIDRGDVRASEADYVDDLKSSSLERPGGTVAACADGIPAIARAAPR